jgi:Leishmanolysin
LPIQGEMTFDNSDLEAMHREGTLADVIAHEMGHVLGFGTIWARKRMLLAARSNEPTFRGRQGRAQYGRLLGTGPQAVPVENLGGSGTRNSHWRESIFGNELMSGFVATAPNPLSALTVASLADLGYVVDTAQAEAYALPTVPLTPDRTSIASQVLSRMRPTHPVSLTG